MASCISDSDFPVCVCVCVRAVCVHQLVTGNSYKVIYSGGKKNSCVAHQGLFLIPSGKVLKVKQLFLQSVSNILSLDVWTPRSLTGVTNCILVESIYCHQLYMDLNKTFRVFDTLC